MSEEEEEEEDPQLPENDLSELTKEELVALLFQANRDRQSLRQDREAFRKAMERISDQTMPPPPPRPEGHQARTALRKMVDPERFCGGAKDLDRFLTQLRRRFTTQSQQFAGDDDKVDYAISLLGKWESNQESALKQTKMTNPSDWGMSLVKSNDPCLSDFDAFE